MAKTPYQLWQEEQKKKQEGKIQPSRSPRKSNNIQYTAPSFKGSSETRRESHQWEKDILKDLPIKKHGRSYNDKFNSFAKSEGLSPSEAQEFRTWLDAKEQGVKTKNSFMDGVIKSLNINNRQDAQKIKQNAQISREKKPTQTKPNPSQGEERKGFLGLLDRTLGRASRSAQSVVLGKDFVQLQDDAYRKNALAENDQRELKMTNTVSRDSKGFTEKASDITGAVLGEIGPYAMGYGAADKVMKLNKGLNALKNPIAREFARGSIAGATVGTGKAVVRDVHSDDYGAKDYAKQIGMEAALGGATDAGLSALFKGLSKLKSIPASKQSNAEVPFEQRVKTVLEKKEEPPIQQVSQENIIHDREFEEAVQQQYEYLKKSMGKGTTPGGLVRDQEGYVTGAFGRISNNPRWYSDFYAVNKRKPNNAELMELAKKHVKEGFEDEVGKIPAWSPKAVQEIDDQINELRAIVDEDPNQEVALSPIIRALEEDRSALIGSSLKPGRDFEAIESLAEVEPPLIKVANANAKPVSADYDSVQHIDNLISREVKPTNKKSIGQRVKEFAERTYYNMFDDAYGLGRLDKAKGKNVRDSDSAIALAHRSRGASAKAQQELERGFFDSNGQKVGNSFTDILQNSKNPDKLETYLVAKGILDYDSKGMIALKTDGLNQLELSNKATRQMELENPDIVKEAEEFYTYLKNQRNILKEGGIFNDAQIKQMEENNPNYVPMEREMDEGLENFIPGKEGLRKRLANVGNPVKKRTGSERKIISPFETTVKRQYVYNNMAERNKAGMAVLNHLREMPDDNMFGNIVEMEENAAFKVMKDADDIANQIDNEIPEKINELFRAKEGDNNIIYVYENGNKYKIQVKDKMLFDSMMALDSKSLPVWMNAVNLPVRMLRAGVTLSPDFAVRNLIRDQLTTGITSQKGYIPFVDAVSGAFEIIKGRKGNSELINAYTRNGGDLSVLQNIDRTNNIKTVQELKGNVPIMQKLKKIKEDPTLLLEPFRKLGEFSEMSTRIGHMKKAVQKGETMEQAAYNARSTMDFNRAGAWGRQINQGVAFFNASLQGMDVLARSFKDRPLQTATNVGLYVVAPTVALYHLNKDQQWFKDLPEKDRDQNWFIPVGEEIVKIPKPFEAGILFGASVERGLDKYYNNKGGEYEGYIKELAGSFTPEIIPTSVKPLLEVYTNKNFFTGNAIDSMGDQMLPAKDRYNAYNSQFAIKVAEIFSKAKPNTEISPKDVDHLVRGYTGTLGTSVNEGLDSLLTKFNPDIPEKPDRGSQTAPFIRSLVVRNLEGNNKPTNDFYERFEELRSMKKTQGEKFQLADEKSVVEKTYKAISDLQKEKKNVLNSTTLDGKTKAQQIKNLNEQITEMAREVNKLKPNQ